MLATIVDVARAARVSPATVSRVLSGRPLVAPATRARVEAVIARLQYTPNGLARGLATKRTATIALVLPDINNPFFPALARGVQDVAEGAAFQVMLANTDGSVDRERAQLRTFEAKQVEGVIIVSSGITAGEVRALAARGVQVVLAGRNVQSEEALPAPCDWVRIDNRSGARVAAAHLLGLGHGRVGTITGPLTISTSLARLAGYRDALADAGIPFDPALVEEGDFRFSGGYQAAGRLLGRVACTGLVVSNDMMAIGAVQAIKARGLRVPGDLSVIGFDDMPLATIVAPPLTTMSVPSYVMGERAARMLFDRIRGFRGPAREEIMHPQLITRQSTAGPEGSAAPGGGREAGSVRARPGASRTAPPDDGDAR